VAMIHGASSVLASQPAMAPSSATRMNVRSPGDELPSAVDRCFSRSSPVKAPMRHAIAKAWIVAPSSAGDIARF